MSTTTTAVRLTVADEHERREILAILASRLASRADSYNEALQAAAYTHPDPTWALEERLAERYSLRGAMKEMEDQVDELLGADLPATVELDLTAHQLELELTSTIDAVADKTKGGSHRHPDLDIEACYAAGMAASRLTERIRSEVS